MVLNDWYDSSISYSHLGPKFLSPYGLAKTLQQCERALSTHEFDTLAFRGMSGAFLGPALAARMDKQMILVRKPEDSTHYRQDAEGYRYAQRYIIVDDFVASGDTKKAIIESVREFAPDACFVGLLQAKYLSDLEIDFHIGEGTPYPLN